jgi:EmrB/QacA subfamily drug resistance transporter
VDVRRVRLVLAGLVVAILMASLDQTILSTALPTIVAELDGIRWMSWVITAYTSAATIVMPVYGRVGDLVGHKPVFLAAIVLFLLGSVIGGLADSMPVLVAGRFVQGLGGGGLIITSQALIADVVPPRQRGRYLGVMGAVFAASSVAGPLLGGYFTEVAGWRWCFWINLPLGTAALLIAVRVLPRRPGAVRRPQLDWAGMALIAVAVTAVVLLSGWAGHTYAWTSPQIIGLSLAAVLAGVAFVAVERRAAEPVIPLSLMRGRVFVLATTAGMLLAICMFASISYLPTFLQRVGGHSPSTAGLLILPMMAGVLVASIVSGQLISRTGTYKIYPIVGLLLTGTTLLLMSTMGAGTGTVTTSVYVTLLGVGIGLTMQVLVLVVQNAVAHGSVGTATAANNFFREIGASLGITAVGTLFTARLTSRLSAGQSEPVAYAEALTPIFGWLAPLCLVALILIAALQPIPLRTSNDDRQIRPASPAHPTT